MSANVMNKIKHRLKPNDRIYTPPKIVDIMLDFCDYKKGESVLEGAKGKGAIYDKLSEPKEYCEIDEDIDFFDYNKKVEWIITNPPYSILDKWFKHSYTICNKFCYIIGCYSLTPKRLEVMNENKFYITKMLLLKIPNWFQRAYIIVCEKLDKEPDNIIFKSIHIGNKCLHCGQPVGGMKRSKTVKHCKRKASENECHY
jgi:hypothetical protein|tara:strand:+ start:6053 stop:6649 length:597 start_codon:yes stop_codon:yes gene_type:complete